MKTLLTRAFSGTVYVILIMGSIIWGPFAFGILFLFFLVLSLLEFNKLALKAGFKPEKFTFLSVGIILYLLVLLYSWDYLAPASLLLSLPLLFLIFIVEVFRKEARSFGNIGLSVLGLIYIVIPLSIINLLFYPGFDISVPYKEFLYGFFILIWMNDIFAYLTGTLFGKHKLFNRISPNKTWEGSIGGAVFSVAGAYVLSLFFHELNILEWTGLAFTIIIFGTFGDLFESMLKRNLDLKDSGSIMPGHGGVLDRLDSILFAAPFVFIYFAFVINQ